MCQETYTILEVDIGVSVQKSIHHLLLARLSNGQQQSISVVLSVHDASHRTSSDIYQAVYLVFEIWRCPSLNQSHSNLVVMLVHCCHQS